MHLDNKYLYEKTKEYVPGWCFKYTHGYGSKKTRREEVRVVDTYPHHILVTNDLYNYSVTRYDLYLQKYGLGEETNVEESGII